MKTKLLTKSYRSFLTESKCSISFNPLAYGWLAAILLSTVLIFSALYLSTDIAIVFWQLVAILLIIGAVLIRGVLINGSGQEITITCYLPANQVFVKGRYYQLAASSRYSFFGFWLILEPIHEHQVAPNENANLNSAGSNNAFSSTISVSSTSEQARLFLPRYQLSRQAVAYLTFLTSAAQH